MQPLCPAALPGEPRQQACMDTAHQARAALASHSRLRKWTACAPAKWTAKRAQDGVTKKVQYYVEGQNRGVRTGALYRAGTSNRGSRLQQVHTQRAHEHHKHKLQRRVAPKAPVNQACQAAQGPLQADDLDTQGCQVR